MVKVTIKLIQWLYEFDNGVKAELTTDSDGNFISMKPINGPVSMVFYL